MGLDGKSSKQRVQEETSVRMIMDWEFEYYVKERMKALGIIE